MFLSQGGENWYWLINTDFTVKANSLLNTRLQPWGRNDHWLLLGLLLQMKTGVPRPAEKQHGLIVLWAGGITASHSCATLSRSYATANSTAFTLLWRFALGSTCCTWREASESPSSQSHRGAVDRLGRKHIRKTDRNSSTLLFQALLSFHAIWIYGAKTSPLPHQQAWVVPSEFTEESWWIQLVPFLHNRFNNCTILWARSGPKDDRSFIPQHRSDKSIRKSPHPPSGVSVKYNLRRQPTPAGFSVVVKVL